MSIVLPKEDGSPGDCVKSAGVSCRKYSRSFKRQGVSNSVTSSVQTSSTRQLKISGELVWSWESAVNNCSTKQLAWRLKKRNWNRRYVFFSECFHAIRQTLEAIWRLAVDKLDELNSSGNCTRSYVWISKPLQVSKWHPQMLATRMQYFLCDLTGGIPWHWWLRHVCALLLQVRKLHHQNEINLKEEETRHEVQLDQLKSGIANLLEDFSAGNLSHNSLKVITDAHIYTS